ncbi:MAG: hypothetical protein VB048_08770 [Bacteroidaceae bacterium]|nr:hypothetical protein [Bacteroidaceae bacterium]
MKNKIMGLSSFIIFLSFLSSCFIDIPSTETQFNDPNLFVPPVVNHKNNDSIWPLINIDTKRNSIFNSFDYNVYTIVSAKYHLGFPDLTKYNNTWFITMRFSEGHMPEKISYAIIYKSQDLENWEQEQIFIQEGFDIRDPKLLIADNTLYIHFNSTTINPYGEIRHDYISKYNPRTKSWEQAIRINKNSNLKSWFWRITYNQGKFYTAGYSGGQLRLFESDNGINFHELYHFDSPGILSEATLRFSNKKAYILIRVNKGGETLFGVADENDLKNWTINTLPIFEIGGPNFLFYKDMVLLSGRNISKTCLYYYDPSSHQLKDTGIIFPAGGDTGYPGMYLENDILYILYYSAANSGSRPIVNSLNLAVIDLNQILN